MSIDRERLARIREFHQPERVGTRFEKDGEEWFTASIRDGDPWMRCRCGNSLPCEVRELADAYEAATLSETPGAPES